MTTGQQVFAQHLCETFMDHDFRLVVDGAETDRHPTRGWYARRAYRCAKCWKKNVVTDWLSPAKAAQVPAVEVL